MGVPLLSLGRGQAAVSRRDGPYLLLRAPRPMKSIRPAKTSASGPTMDQLNVHQPTSSPSQATPIISRKRPHQLKEDQSIVVFVPPMYVSFMERKTREGLDKRA